MSLYWYIPCNTCRKNKEEKMKTKKSEVATLQHKHSCWVYYNLPIIINNKNFNKCNTTYMLNITSQSCWLWFCLFSNNNMHYILLNIFWQIFWMNLIGFAFNTFFLNWLFFPLLIMNIWPIKYSNCLFSHFSILYI